MNKQQVYDRINVLMNAYHWSLNNNKILSAGQRICITMERVQLLRCLEQLKAEPFMLVKPKYSIPAHLEEKVQHITHMLRYD
ncbi:hypothetical protein [Cellulophaga lytica]|uniref:hypothetical protein n=1 Tax=Cellulophaga lytica TaxID=979 RepID=UPI003CE560B2